MTTHQDQAQEGDTVEAIVNDLGALLEEPQLHGGDHYDEECEICNSPKRSIKLIAGLDHECRASMDTIAHLRAELERVTAERDSARERIGHWVARLETFEARAEAAEAKLATLGGDGVREAIGKLRDYAHAAGDNDDKQEAETILAVLVSPTIFHEAPLNETALDRAADAISDRWGWVRAIKARFAARDAVDAYLAALRPDHPGQPSGQEE